MPEAMICVSVNQTMVDMPKVTALMPLCAQGDTEDKPKPVPKMSKIKDSTAAAAAPAKTALHATALEVFSSIGALMLAV